MKLISGAVASVLAASALAGCGGTTESAKDTKAAAAASASASASRAAEQAAEARQKAAAKKRAEESAVFKECKAAAGRLDDDLTALNSRLEVGVDFQKYSDSVGDARVDYDKMIRVVNGPGVSDQCLRKVAVPLETSLNAHIKAYNTWNNCINATYCAFDKGSTALKKTQKSWLKAGIAGGKADAALSKLQP